MTREQLIDYGNRSLYGIWASDSKETMDYLTEFCLMRDKDKGPLAIQIYMQLSEQQRRSLIQRMIDYYCTELHINKIYKIIKSPFGEQFQIIKYF